MSFAEVAEALERSRAGETQEALAAGDGVSGAPFARRLKQALPAALGIYETLSYNKHSPCSRQTARHPPPCPTPDTRDFMP
jgi:hypothetical protein